MNFATARDRHYNRAMPVIGLDLGGTKLAAAIFNHRGEILRKSVVPVGGRNGAQVCKLVTDELNKMFAAARAQGIKVRGIGVSVPGISYAKTGRVWAPNIPGWAHPGGIPLRREMVDSLADKRIPMTIDSDRACYILGEAWRGAARGCRNAIFLAVGTGIGAGVLVDGEVLRGANDSAGAIGWLALDRPFRPEYKSCGCFEYHASGAGLVKISNSGCRRAEEVFHDFDAGDPAARRVLSEAVELWGMAAANLVSLFNPEKIIFGGGVFGPARKLLPQILAEAVKWAQPVAMRQVKFEISKLGGDAGLYGAGCLALRARKKTG